jgi:release factor glutamine methyltransferase
MTTTLDARQIALVNLGLALRAAGYVFVTPTPETHRRVNGRPQNLEAKTLRDVFGWNRPFRPSRIPEPLLELGQRAGVLVRDVGHGERWRSLVRYSTLSTPEGDLLLVHSDFPTERADSVFFGPDSYRFAAFLRSQVPHARRLADVGCGTGVGGLALGQRVDELILADVNPEALRLAEVNVALARAAGATAPTISVVASDVLDGIDGALDAVIANPPYLVDDSHRLYRDGGGPWGTSLALRIADESLARMGPGGRLVLYTGTPIVEGRNVLADTLETILRRRAASWQWQELDPDVFGDELERQPYRNTDRLAVVGLTAIVR